MHKKYGLLTAIAMVVGTVMGSGVFFKAEAVLTRAGGEHALNIEVAVAGRMMTRRIMGIASYGKLAGMLGKKDVEEKYVSTARDMAAKWKVMAYDNDHYRLTFDKPGTWSQKYNLVWDRLLNLNLFPKEVAEKELAFYRTCQNRYGLPLDNRRTYTKLDWILWSATLTGKAEDFAALLDPVYLWLNETPTRVPLTDWYETTDGKKVGFQARSVVGGVFLRMMSEPELRKKER